MENWNLSLQNQTSHILNGSNGSISINDYTDRVDQLHSGFAYYLFEIIWPIISSLGIVGNILSFVVMFQLSKSSSFYLYLASLALSDMATLVVGGIFRGLTMIGLHKNIENVYETLCYVDFDYALIHVLSQLSSWITVAVTADRYVAVCHPFHVKKYCTKKHALCYIGVAFLVIVALNFPSICFQWDDENASCVVPEFTNDYCFKYSAYIEMVVYVLVPFCLICVFNALIIRGIITSASGRRNITSGNGSSSSSSTNNDSTLRTAIMLLTVTTCFICLFLPLVVYTLYEIVYDKILNSNFIAAVDICILLNHAINFVLYGLSGQRFREKFAAIFCLRRFVQR
ncbi:FMRFamide receptor [Mizuhopecten yessoensis]|uniref:FMRFamide receptor n=1 Tax=Mizuhopecten yessoensis TaxID=6573 RepID=A0A210R660_MIZYE|nr:FMRFamide receptor [Mizuhopecten yessoensis]